MATGKCKSRLVRNGKKSGPKPVSVKRHKRSTEGTRDERDGGPGTIAAAGSRPSLDPINPLDAALQPSDDGSMRASVIGAGVVGCAVGSSFAVLVSEELFASGCSLLISLTSSGQILPVRAPP